MSRKLNHTVLSNVYLLEK